ncbi:MAG: GGDEF domain-containing protein [Desulfobacteraceae bacterium]|nr:GGDEF domain-containing protein [Desulfobacteraceae bacterium]
MLIGTLDYLTGNDFEVDVFYVLPLFFITWFASRRAAVASTVLITLVWMFIGKATGKISPSVTVDIWNAFMEFAFLLIITVLGFIVKHQILRLEELSREDFLTGAANRRSFYQVAEMEMNRSQRFGSPFSVVYLDVDNFKAVNDTLGHSAGDLLLCEVAGAMHQHIRKIDTIARLGGDEFALLFPETDAGGARHMVEKTKEILIELVARHGWPITFSMGVVTFTQPPGSVEEMLCFADKVMYSVKRQGKNSIAFESWPEAKLKF